VRLEHGVGTLVLVYKHSMTTTRDCDHNAGYGSSFRGNHRPKHKTESHFPLDWRAWSCLPKDIAVLNQCRRLHVPAADVRYKELENDRLSIHPLRTIPRLSNAGDFSQSAKTYGTTLAAGASCTVSITFAPTATGSSCGYAGCRGRRQHQPSDRQSLWDRKVGYSGDGFCR
jgi:hypothetical protein